MLVRSALSQAVHLGGVQGCIDQSQTVSEMMYSGYRDGNLLLMPPGGEIMAISADLHILLHPLLDGHGNDTSDGASSLGSLTD